MHKAPSGILFNKTVAIFYDRTRSKTGYIMTFIIAMLFLTNWVSGMTTMPFKEYHLAKLLAY